MTHHGPDALIIRGCNSFFWEFTCQPLTFAVILDRGVMDHGAFLLKHIVVEGIVIYANLNFTGAGAVNRYTHPPRKRFHFPLHW